MNTENDIMATRDGEPLRESAIPAGFGEWLPDPFTFKVLLQPDHGQWYATAEDFDVVGAGATPREAAIEVLELVEAYLLAFFEDGDPYEAALRPMSISATTKLESMFGNLVAGVLRGAGDRLPLPREKRLGLPVSADAYV